MAMDDNHVKNKQQLVERGPNRGDNTDFDDELL